MTAVFVTATGTDIGKTYVTAGLIRVLWRQGKSACALKPVISGFNMEAAANSDSGLLLQAMGQEVTPQTIARISPWRFCAPLSPDMAAAREKRVIGFSELVSFCRNEIDSSEGTLFIEGVGGVMVPLDSTHTVLDWIVALDIPVILVSGTYLGAISHTLTALNALASRATMVRALVLNESESAPVPVEETIETISRFVPEIPVSVIPRAKEISASSEAFRQLCERMA
jgi:dethiobiotin synthetase